MPLPPPTPDGETVSRRCVNCKQRYHGALVCPACGDPAGVPHIEDPGPLRLPAAQRFTVRLVWGCSRPCPPLEGAVRVTLLGQASLKPQAVE